MARKKKKRRAVYRANRPLWHGDIRPGEVLTGVAALTVGVAAAQALGRVGGS